MKKTRTSYNQQASSYEKRWKSYLEHTHSEFLGRLKVNEGSRILDVSCGTGLLALELIERDAPFSELILNDISEEMISIVENRVGGHPTIRFTRQGANRIDRIDGTFDLILCLNAFHYYENQERVIQNFFRLLNNEGSVCILDWNRIGLFRPVNYVISRFTPEHIDTRSDREMKELLTDAGFRVPVLDSWAYRYWRFYFAEGLLAH